MQVSFLLSFLKVTVNAASVCVTSITLSPAQVHTRGQPAGCGGKETALAGCEEPRQKLLSGKRYTEGMKKTECASDLHNF